jgi:hypothetical protein
MALGRTDGSRCYRRCVNFDSRRHATGCSLRTTRTPHCIACRITRTIPDQNDSDNRRWWLALETAKRRMVSQLLALELPVRAKVGEDPERGLAFDLLRSPPQGPRVMTGHAGA